MKVCKNEIEYVFSCLIYKKKQFYQDTSEINKVIQTDQANLA